MDFKFPDLLSMNRRNENVRRDRTTTCTQRTIAEVSLSLLAGAVVITGLGQMVNFIPKLFGNNNNNTKSFNNKKNFRR